MSIKGLTILTALILVGCGGGGGDAVPTTDPQETVIAGGTASSPVVLDLTQKHAINTNPSTNYFSYTAQAGEMLIIQTVLNTPLTNTERSRCSLEGGSGNTSDYTSRALKTDIIVYDFGFNAIGGNCYGNLTYTFSQDGTYIIYFDFSSNSNFGAYNVASVI